MKNQNVRLYALFGALFVGGLLALSTMRPAIQVANAQPNVIPWGGWSLIPNQRTGTTYLYSDTLPRFSADSVVTTDSFPLSGARAIQVHVQGSASDSNAVPVMQVQLPGGQWQAINATSFPYIGVTVGTATTILGQHNSVMLQISGETAGGGTPLPWIATWGRLRIKSADARRYSGASGTNLSATGTMTYRVYLLR